MIEGSGSKERIPQKPPSPKLKKGEEQRVTTETKGCPRTERKIEKGKGVKGQPIEKRDAEMAAASPTDEEKQSKWIESAIPKSL